jgi:hypothetical protein
MSGLRRVGAFIMALLRELGDENAYRRHLAAHGRRWEAQGLNYYRSEQVDWE